MADSGWTTVSYKKVKTSKPVVIPQSQPFILPKKKDDTVIRKSQITNKNKSQVNSKKIEEQAEDGNYEIPKVSAALKLQIQQERQKKGWTQKQLAQQCNLQESIIRNYETGSCIPNQSDISKMSRALGVSLSNK